jgi:hypothetical protein
MHTSTSVSARNPLVSTPPTPNHNASAAGLDVDDFEGGNTFHHIHIQNQLLTMTGKGLEQALRQQKKGNKKSRALPLI